MAESAACKPHRRGARYVNPPPEERQGMTLKAAAWLLGFPFRRREASAPTPFRSVSPTSVAASPTKDLRVTWLGHSTVLVQFHGCTILTDPVFSRRASPLSFVGPKREVPLPLQREELPRIDIILLSHDHYDHLEFATLRLVAERDEPVIVAPAGVGERVRSAGVTADVRELEWGESTLHRGFRLHCTPARHFSGRGLADRNKTLWCSWFAEPTEAYLRSVYFAGDSGYGDHFADTYRRHGPPALILVPIGAYEPNWFMRPVHVTPEEAVRAVIEMSTPDAPPHVLPIHWGTFRLTDEPLDEPPSRFLKAAAEQGLAQDRLHVLPVGGSVELATEG